MLGYIPYSLLWRFNLFAAVKEATVAIINITLSLNSYNIIVCTKDVF